jgi:hypothetical protein
MQVMDRAEVIQWRKAERQRLIAERLAVPGDIRRHYAAGGFVELTFATMKNSPLKLGVGYRQQALLTIHP